MVLMVVVTGEEGEWPLRQLFRTWWWWCRRERPDSRRSWMFRPKSLLDCPERPWKNPVELLKWHCMCFDFADGMLPCLPSLRRLPSHNFANFLDWRSQ